MRPPHIIVVAVVLFLVMAASACSSAPTGVASPTYTAVPTTAGAREVVVYASDLQQSALSELNF